MHLRPWYWLLLGTLPALALAGVHKSVEHEHWTDAYDRYFRKYAKHYFGPHFDWRWFKAQGIAESGLDPKAESPAGAKGIMQILPSTYAEIRRKNPFFADISHPRWNIAAAIYYDRSLYRKWKKRELPTGQRLPFALASYNAGLGNVLKAWRRAREQLGEVREWEQVAPFAPGETRHYVRRIRKLMKME